LEKWVSSVKGLPQHFKILFGVANAHANDLNAAAPLSLISEWNIEWDDSRRTKRGSVVEIYGDDLFAGLHPYMFALSSCKGCVSTAMPPLCLWPCSCYVSQAIGGSKAR